MTKQTLPDTIEIDGVKYQRVEEPKEPKTLYQMLDDKYCPDACAFVCDIVKEWMSQFNPDDMGFKNLAYLTGFSDAIEELRSNLRQDT